MRIYITRKIPEAGLALLGEYEVEVREEQGPIAKSELLKKVVDVDGLLCLLTDPVDEEVIAAGNRLKCISNYAVGFNNIDVLAATKKGIIVTNTPGVLTDTTADLAFTLLLSSARRIAESDRFMRAGEYIGWDPMLHLGWDVHGKTLGIVGFGKIGIAMARRAKGFDMKVLYHDQARSPGELEQQLGAQFAEMKDLIAESDFISLHVPLTDSTRHFIGEEQLGMMKKTAVLVNTSRGPVVDEQALAEALRDGVIAAAGLDVYENEPRVNPLLEKLPNVTLAAHIGSASHRTRSLMAEMAAENLIAGLSGKRPKAIVNPDVLDRKP